MPLLSIIVPVYNEAKTVQKILEKLHELEIDKEIIVVDDSSTDGTDRVLREVRYDNLKVIHHSSNRGKGAAFLTGLDNASGEMVIIQDADLEYDPQDYYKLIAKAQEVKADLVLGARFTQGYRGLFLHRLGNRLLTSWLNILFCTQINDYSTCYKLARKSVFEQLHLRASGFDIEAEIVCSAIKQKMSIVEVPVAYYPRTYRQGKKIRWSDGLWAIFSILKYRLRN